MKNSIGAPAIRFGTQQREVGSFEKFNAIGRIGGGHRDTDTHADQDLVAVEIEGPADDLDDPLAQRSGFSAIGHAALKDGKFVAAQARDGVRLANAEAQPRADLLEELVAKGMPKGIVDVLEVVEVEA